MWLEKDEVRESSTKGSLVSLGRGRDGQLGQTNTLVQVMAVGVHCETRSHQ